MTLLERDKGDAPSGQLAPFAPSTPQKSVLLLPQYSLVGANYDYDEDEDEDIRDPYGYKSRVALTMQKFQGLATQADVFATAHILPVHVLCIWIATIILPVSAITIIWDLLAAVVFQIPTLSTINTPAFVLFINFVAIPLAIYGYMMEYLMHEHSRLAIFGLISVVVHPILFLLRAIMEYYFDGFRGENKIYFEAFNEEGKEAIYPIGIIRYKQGIPFSDSEEGRRIIDQEFFQMSDMLSNASVNSASNAGAY